MKTYKVIVLSIMGLFLVNCDDSKSKMDDIKQQVVDTSSAVGDKAQDLYEKTKLETENILNQIKDGNYNLAQDLIIKAVKQKLPSNVDQNVTLVDVAKDDNMISYKYSVNNLTKDALQAQANQNAMLAKLKTFYCSKDIGISAIRSAFTQGETHNYYINNDKALTLTLKPSDCDNK